MAFSAQSSPLAVEQNLIFAPPPDLFVLTEKDTVPSGQLLKKFPLQFVVHF